MHQVTVHTPLFTSRVLIGERAARFPDYLPKGRQVVIITDAAILRLHRELTQDYPVIEIGSGEEHKTLQTAEQIYHQLVSLGADRSTFVVGIGGGIVCDVTGFAASTYMRGLRFGFVPTTLLSQVDASVGGKNGVNLGGFKNMVGTFVQPEFVLCDPRVLQTLPRTELVQGFAEIVKAGAIRDAALFDYLEQHAVAALNGDEQALEHIILQSVRMKAGVVERDEHEQGERRVLNFGHTFGHAIEKLTKRPHGEAVSIGMAMAARISVRLGMLDAGDALRLNSLLQALSLPVETCLPVSALFEALKKDKKKEGDALHLVLLRALGHADVQSVPVSEVETLMSQSL